MVLNLSHVHKLKGKGEEVLDPILCELLPYFPFCLQDALASLSCSVQRSVREVRMKEGCPSLLITSEGRHLLSQTELSAEDIASSFRKICSSSAYTYRNEIRSGFVTLPGGHRVGIVGTAVLSDSGRVEGMRNIYGLIVRIAREYESAIDDLLPSLVCGGRVRNLLLFGPPGSGKTTVLRSLAKRLSATFQVSVVDEREELFPSVRSVPVGCDVLRGFPKSVGILQALRTLSPQVIVCDELGTSEEVRAMLDGVRSGVALVASAHAYCVKEIFDRPAVRELFLSGGVDFAAFLDPNRTGHIRMIKERDSLCDEISSFAQCVSSLCGRSGNLCD